MSAPSDPNDRELVLTRIINAPREKVFRAWAEPVLLKQWFMPPPYVTIFGEPDVRPGGENFVIMRGPDGIDMPNRGVYLEVVPNEELVLTDAYTKAWETSDKPFMTVVLTFENEGGKPNTPPASCTGPSPIAKLTRRWVSAKAVELPPTSLWRSSPLCRISPSPKQQPTNPHSYD